MAGIAAVFAELERALIGQRTAEAFDQLRSEEGSYGPEPYGYDSEGGRLVANPAEQAVLGFIRSMRDGGLSYARIAAWLNHEEIPAKQGGIWHPMSVRSVLQTSERLKGAELQEAVAERLRDLVAGPIREGLSRPVQG